jgi:hypothetical protein
VPEVPKPIAGISAPCAASFGAKGIGGTLRGIHKI